MKIEEELLSLVGTRFAQSFRLIAHAAGQLDDAQLWTRPSSRSNSVGIILQHLTGNLNQWVLDGLGGRKYERNRPAEFFEAEHRSKKIILDGFARLGEDVQDVIAHVRPGALLDSRRIQGFDHTQLSALIAAVTHCDLHAGQIAYVAKLLLDERYQESWKPATPEQGSH